MSTSVEEIAKAKSALAKANEDGRISVCRYLTCINYINREHDIMFAVATVTRGHWFDSRNLRFEYD